MADTAKAFGLEVPFLRPAELAQDQSLVVDVIVHALEVLPEAFTHVALVQATSPTVTSDDIDSAVRLAIERNADTVITGFLAGQRHPMAMYELDADGAVRWLLANGRRMARRQDLPQVFIRTGLVYVIKADVVRYGRSIYGDKIAALTVEESRALTIDEEADFHMAEFVMQRMGRASRD